LLLLPRPCRCVSWPQGRTPQPCRRSAPWDPMRHT
jgi:hypothetical protein